MAEWSAEVSAGALKILAAIQSVPAEHRMDATALALRGAFVGGILALAEKLAGPVPQLGRQDG